MVVPSPGSPCWCNDCATGSAPGRIQELFRTARIVEVPHLSVRLRAGSVSTGEGTSRGHQCEQRYVSMLGFEATRMLD